MCGWHWRAPITATTSRLCTTGSSKLQSGCCSARSRLWGWYAWCVSRSLGAAAGLLPPRLCTDAYLAALAIANGWRLVSFDRDFGRFEGLQWLQPA
jgi:hypothetical protein